MNSTGKKILIAIWGICVVWYVCVLLPSANAAPASLFTQAPDNAALLYYQAFQLRPKPYDEVEQLVYNTQPENLYDLLRGSKVDPDPEVEISKIEKSIYELEQKIKNHTSGPNEKMSPRERARFESERYKERLFSQLEYLKKKHKYYEKMSGVDLNKKIRYYLSQCREVIAVAQVASKIPECNWGTMCSHEFGYISPDPMEIKNFARLLIADAVRLAADGDYRVALERCLSVRRFARQVRGENNMLCLLSLAFDVQSLESIQFILCIMPPDEELLKWLQSQFVSIQGIPQLFAKSLEREFKLTLQRLRTNRKLLRTIRIQLVESTEYKNAKKRFLNLTDENLIAMVRKPYAKFLDSTLQALSSKKPYEQTYRRIESLSNELFEQYKDNPAIGWTIEDYVESMPNRYNVHIAHSSYLNAIKAAIEIYISAVNTGQLPKALPDYLPKDPYSGQDFEYKVTEEGFILRCRVKPINQDEIWQYEFKVKK